MGLLCFADASYALQRRRWWLLLSHSIQGGLILLIGILKATKAILDTGPTRYVAIVLLSGGSGMQVAIARTLNCPEIPTAMRRSTCSLVSRH